MRWFLGLFAGVALLLSGAAPASASASQPDRPAGPGDGMAPPAVLVLVERLTMDEALDAAGAAPRSIGGPGGPEVAGFVSTLAVHQPMASRVLSLAAGRRVDALDALEGDPAAASGLPGPAAIERIRADNPGARFGRLPPAEVLAWPGQEVAGLLTLGAGGPATAPGPLGPSGPLPVGQDRLLVLAVPDATALANVLGRLEPAGGVAGPVMVVGLRAAPGRANAAPLLVLDPRSGTGSASGSRQGLPTSDSTRRLGLVALEDVRPTVAGGGSESEGDDGSVMRVVERDAVPATVRRLDRRVAALVAARTWAIPLLCLAAVLALFALVATWRGLRGGSGDRRGGPQANWSAARAARVLLALTWALPSGYLLASMAEPVAARLRAGALGGPGSPALWGVAWVASGVAAAALLSALALRLDHPAPGRPRVRAPVLLGAVLLGLVALDLLLGGHGLSQPLIGGSAWDGERFYGLGNGYFAFALASVMLVAGFAPLPAAATAALLAGLGVVDGLPRLGADVGGALTSMLTAAAALVVLAPGRPKVRRAVLLAALAVAAAVAVALGAGLGGPLSHAGRFAERLRAGPGDAAGMVVDQLARNLRLLANSPFAWAGPLQILAAGLIALRPPRPLDELPEWIRRVLGLGALGSLLLILLNDTGVTATSASGLFLLAIPAWAWLEQRRPPASPAAPGGVLGAAAGVVPR
jgi:hypothetical protein